MLKEQEATDKQLAALRDKRVEERLAADAKAEADKRRKYIRMVDGVAYDFYDVLTAHEQYVAMGKSEDNDWKNRELPVDQSFHIMQDNLEIEKKASAIISLYRTYRLSGKVIQVTKDGVLVQPNNTSFYDAIMFVTDYKNQGVAVDGDAFSSFGIGYGRYQYVNVMGATKTVAVFHCARKPNDPSIIADVKKLP